MVMKKKKQRRKTSQVRTEEDGEDRKRLEIDPEIRNSIFAVSLSALALVLILSFLNLAGPWGKVIFRIFDYLLGWGYFILPLLLIIIAFSFFRSLTRKINPNFLTLIGMGLVLLSSLSLLELFFPHQGGIIGKGGMVLHHLFGFWASLIITGAVLISGFLLVLNTPLHFPHFRRRESLLPLPVTDEEEEEEEEAEQAELPEEVVKEATTQKKKENIVPFKTRANYKFPPLSLLETEETKPRGGDIRANANIIKRTLENFGIEVEMGEVNVGPTVTQYTLHPMEGIKLSSITALQNDLSLALAAHPLRIEAPIPGKSLVGIEVPNKAISLVRLGNLFREMDLKKHIASLTFPLGRDVKGTVISADLAAMHHLLIAGATGAGKSVCIHSIISSLLLENSPESLRLILIDPKRVELSRYNGIDHLLTPVIVDNKKVIPTLRWTIHEMERRYDLLSQYKARDIKTFNLKANANKVDHLPFIIVMIDELADLMMAYGRDLEELIIRIAQMARATGIHLVVSTQRPSVEVITGLIKANITARVAFQVASQVDSRTILDMGGAEKLLGHGDMLYLSPSSSKPRRIQGSFVSEKEIDQLVNFVIKESNNETNGLEEDLEGFMDKHSSVSLNNIALEEWEEEDELYSEAYDTIVKAGKASASLLQRKLRIGYARAARLLDSLEERGVIGPVDGAKPREVFVNSKEDQDNE